MLEEEGERRKVQQAVILALAAIAVLAAYCSMDEVFALPTGASITYNATSGQPSSSPSSRADPRVTITTLVLNGLQQDQSWKGYVGNITGRLSLDDASGMTIYDWALSAVNKSGQVFVSRLNTVDFTNVSCINSSIITAEQSNFSMSATASDNVNATFNYTNHELIAIQGAGITISANTCRSTATYVNDTAQAMNGNQRFQEVLLQDSTNAYAVYTAIFSANSSGFDNRNYDFQMIVPDKTSGAATTYYFYTQLLG